LYKRAALSTVQAAERSGRDVVVALLEKFGEFRATDVPFDKLPEYIDEVEALPAKPKTAEVSVKFAIGDTVQRHNGYGPAGKVVGYEVRYIVQTENGGSPSWGYKGDALKAFVAPPPKAPEAPQASYYGSTPQQWEPSRYNK
jgi:hypothetical protein